eukprot:m.481548 g.481548  ORF g.481548 m.481548 type:complete len:250 (+) comp22209_c0_seq1:254-1003(+)
MQSDTILAVGEGPHEAFYNHDGTVSFKLTERPKFRGSAWHCSACEGLFHVFNRSHKCAGCFFPVCGSCSFEHPLVKGRVCASCYSTTVPLAAGLQECPWWHGRIDRHEAARRMQVAGPLPGDFMVREAETRDGALVLTARDGMDVINIKLSGEAGAWYIPGARKHMYKTLQTLIPKLLEDLEISVVERAIIVSKPPSAGFGCPTCSRPVSHTVQPFCDCGARLRSSVEAAQVFELQGNLARTLGQDEEA